MNCEEWGRELELWLSKQWEEGGRTAQPPQALRDHAAACPECSPRFQAALVIMDGIGLRAAPPPELEARVATRLRGETPRWLGVASRPGLLRRFAAPVRGRVLARILVPAAAAVIAVLAVFVVLRVSRPAEPAVVQVLLVLEAPQATQVSAVGDWNAWDPRANPLSDPDGDGVWTVEIQVPRHAEIRYQFLIDDEEWVPDPHAPFQVDDGFGGTASILQI